MNVINLGKLAATLWLGATLSGCIDATVDVALTSETTAKVTMTQTMGPDFYAMVKQGGAEGGEEFCAEGELTEAADGSATCMVTEEGAFADLNISTDDNSISFTSAGAGLVRVSLPLEDLRGEAGMDEQIDDESRAMMEAFFADNTITIRFSGLEVTESNMTISGDRRAAEAVIPFMELINTDSVLPAEYFAVVRVR